VLPEPGYHDAMRALTRKYGTLLVIDETHTICAGPGGATMAWGLEPDFFVIGKTIGGGMPAAAYGMTAAVNDVLERDLYTGSIDTSGVGGTLAGNALALAAVRATLSTTLTDADFATMIPLATEWADGVQLAIDDRDLPWNVQQLGARAEYWFCSPPKNGKLAHDAIDEDLDRLLHLYALNRGILMAPFHNMALFSPHHTQADVDRHTEMFEAVVKELTA
jgi:glutamate-1-semialdehyde 2,1-aminomutase